MDEEIPYYQEVKIAGDSFLNKLKRAFTSALLFVLAFICSNMLLQAITAWMSVSLKYKIHFSYNQVHVFPWDYHYWSRTNIILIFFLSPVVCFIIGFILTVFLRIYTEFISEFRIFFFWLMVCLLNMVLTHALLSPLGSPVDRHNGLYQTFAVVGVFLWINPTLMFIVAVGALASTLFLGIGLRDEVMRYSFSNKLIKNKSGMDHVVIQVYVMPILMGALPVILLCNPVGFFTTVMQLANLGVISIGIFMMNSIGLSKVRSSKDDVLNHFPFVELGVCGVVWFVIFTFLK